MDGGIISEWKSLERNIAGRNDLELHRGVTTIEAEEASASSVFLEVPDNAAGICTDISRSRQDSASPASTF